MSTLPANRRPILIGGLMRCCTETIRTSEEPSEPGTRAKCRWCDEWVIVRSGPDSATDPQPWQWDH